MNNNKVYKMKMQNWQEQFKCVVLVEGAEWTLVHNLFDYSIDGYAILQNKFIKNRLHSEKEDFSEKVLMANNKLVDCNLHIPLTTNKLFEYLKENKIVFQISFKDDSYVYIGKIEKLLQHSFHFKTMSTLGIWDKTIELIRFNSVRIIEFNTDYINSLVTYNQTMEETAVDCLNI